MENLPPTCEPTQPIEDKDIILSFLLEENGKEVTIYQEPEHIFIYTYGVPIASASGISYEIIKGSYAAAGRYRQLLE